MNPPKNFIDVDARIKDLHAKLNKVFSPDTAAPGTDSKVPSAGHCAAVAIIVNQELGGDFLSTIIDGQSHWFNRIYVSGEPVLVDLTGDQFGFDAIQINPYTDHSSNIRKRCVSEIHNETLSRAIILARRAGLNDIAEKIDSRLGLKYVW